MRSLIISITLFLILTIAIIINVGFIHNTADYMSSAATALRTPTENELSDLENFWERNQEKIGLSISNTYLDGIGRIIISLRCAYEAGDIQEVQKNCALLNDAAEEIRRTERLSLGNIF